MSVAEMIREIHTLEPEELDKIELAINAAREPEELDPETAAILEDRMKGPFVPYDPEMFERIKARSRAKLAQQE